MKAEFYITFKITQDGPTYNRKDGLRAHALTQQRPGTPTGDLCVKFVVDIPDEVIKPTIYAKLETVTEAIEGLKATANELAGGT